MAITGKSASTQKSDNKSVLAVWHSITAVEMDRGGSTMTAHYGNLANSCAAQERARTRNTRLSDPSGLTMQEVAVAGDGGNVRGSGGSRVAAFEGEVVTAVAPQEGTTSARSAG